MQFTVSLAGAVAIQTDTTEAMLARVEAALEQATAAGGNRTYFHNGRQAEPAGPHWSGPAPPPPAEPFAFF